MAGCSLARPWQGTEGTADEKDTLAISLFGDKLEDAFEAVAKMNRKKGKWYYTATGAAKTTKPERKRRRSSRQMIADAAEKLLAGGVAAVRVHQYHAAQPAEETIL